MMFLQKICKLGINGIFRVAVSRLRMCLYILLYLGYSQKKIATNRVVLESEGDCSDNAYALYDFMKKNGYLEKYDVIWLVNDINKFHNEDHVKFCTKDINDFRFADTVKMLATCKYYIYDHTNMYLIGFNKRVETEIVFLSHGCTYKGNKGGKYSKNDKCLPDVMIITGDHYIKPMAAWSSVPEDRIVSLGYSRNDWFFIISDLQKREIKKQFGIERYGAIFLWMPTFRQSRNRAISEEYFNNETGLPIIYSKDDFATLNTVLAKINAVLILKLHHLQSELEIFKKSWSNIMILRDEDLFSKGYQLYQFVSVSSALITDYSSIYNDYMLLKKPVVFTLDDYDDYKRSRGLYPIDILKTMKGYHVYKLDDLVEAITDISLGKDRYADERNEWMKECHNYIDGNSSKRILDYIGL